jgi:adenylate kinase family enzyme
MQRVVVMGPPGSGKSTLARSLGARFGLPVFHLDQIYWRPGWIEAPAEAFGAEVERIAELPAWVIDGNYPNTIAPRLRAADTIIYLDVPSWLFMLRLTWRILINYGHVRADAAPGCPEWFDLAFLRFAWSWNRTQRGRNLALVESFPGRKIILRTRIDRHRFRVALRRSVTRSITPPATLP